MVNVFEKKMCNFCKKQRCDKKGIIVIIKNGITIYKCIDYKQDSAKIIPYQKPLSVTAKRDYTDKKEI